MSNIHTALCLYLGSLLFSSPLFAQFRDPTQPAHINVVNTTAQTHHEGVSLSAIWYSEHSKRATLNGKTLKQGQSFNDITLLKIKQNAVVINYQGLIKTLYLIPATYKNAVINH